MKQACIIGESDMKGFTPWWESNLPAWIIVYCLSGESQLTLNFRTFGFRKGMTAIIAPDMFPAFSMETKDFNTFYCLMDREFAEKTFYDVPRSFYDIIYEGPLSPAGRAADSWKEIISVIYDDKDNPYWQNIISSLLHGFALDYYNKWRQQHGNIHIKNERTPAEAICIKFYDLIFDHFKEQRSTAFYAGELCVTPNYLAMVTRQICHETPKEAIDRQVTLEIKYMLRNTGATAEQIADHLHFTDSSYLCRYFRRQTGMFMSQYRQLASEAVI